MNKILFDLFVCQPNRDSKYHGGGIYGCIVFKELCRLAKSNIVAYFDNSRFLDNEVLGVIAKENITVVDASKYNIADAYDMMGCNVLYTPLYSTRHDIIIKRGEPVYLTIHGIRALEMLTDSDEPNYSRTWKEKMKAYIKLSPFGSHIWKKYYREYDNILNSENVRVITVSEHSKYSIKSYFPKVNINNITVFYSPSTAAEGYEKFINNPKEKYYLIISANRWIKNAGRAIQAIDSLLDSNPSICDKVKVLGLKKDTRVYKCIRNKDKFEILGYQTQEDLEKLYAGAYAFIYPTLNEGFGYPPLEAMKYGTPVVSSPFSSIPEICGDAVLYANPYSIYEISNRILQLENSEIYNKLKVASVNKYNTIVNKQHNDLLGLCNLLLELEE